MRIGKLVLGVALLAATAMTAQADEVWKTKIGEIFYEDDIADYAVLSYPAGARNGRAFIKGLAGNYDNRTGVFEGYWTEVPNDTDTQCDVSITDHHGDVTTNWGRLTVVFHTDAYPSGYTIIRGHCFNEPTDALNAIPFSQADYDSGDHIFLEGGQTLNNAWVRDGM